MCVAVSKQRTVCRICLHKLIDHGSVGKNSAKTFAVVVSRVNTLTRDIDIVILSIRLCVRYVPVLNENGLTYCHNFFTIRHHM